MCRQGLAELARIIPGGHIEEAGATAARLLLDGGSLPTAVVTFNDDSALGMLDSFIRSGWRYPTIYRSWATTSWVARLSCINLITSGKTPTGVAVPARRGLVARFARDQLALIGLVLVVAFVSAALAPPVLTPYDPAAQDPTRRLLLPSLQHPLGTDNLGRDLLSRRLRCHRRPPGDRHVSRGLGLRQAPPPGTRAGSARITVWRTAALSPRRAPAAAGADWRPPAPPP